MFYFIYLYFGELCYICKELGLPAHGKQWTEQFSISSSHPSLGDHLMSNMVGSPPRNWILSLTSRCPMRVLCSKGTGIPDVSSHECLPLSLLYWRFLFCLSGLLKTAESITNCCIHLHKLHRQRPLYLPINYTETSISTNKTGNPIALRSPYQRQSHLYLWGAFATQPQ